MYFYDFFILIVMGISSMFGYAHVTGLCTRDGGASWLHILDLFFKPFIHIASDAVNVDLNFQRGTRTGKGE